ncbi:MAG: UvrB/UvrC motif-containing protein [Thermoflexibacter sp.]|jgi:hypothetical protein|nr:UvrB/UvrC motif-containing protein [Thermoflexibacter sp.]
MTEAEKEYAKANHWIIFRGDYPLTEAMNEVFRKDWIRECDIENLFSPPENMLTPIGKIVLPRLAFVRDVLGIALSYEILIQVFQKVKKDIQVGEDVNNTLLHFQLQEAVRKEDYEVAAKLKEKLNLVKT